MALSQRLKAPLSWSELASLVDPAYTAGIDRVNGPTNSQSRLRLFGQSEAAAQRVVLFRDHHAWCPYCQKVWLWLEEKRVPYRIEKVTMFCYGEKESWFTKKVPTGMLPAVELDGRLITESDMILTELERTFGPLGRSINDDQVLHLRSLERSLFSAWCEWLCYPHQERKPEQHARLAFERVAAEVDARLAASVSGFFLENFSIADVVFIPYVERMCASLFYYKGFCVRARWPHIARWLQALEMRETYLGTRSDYHTHAHSLPPQMGGCFHNGTAEQQACRAQVDSGPWEAVPDTTTPAPPSARMEALARVVRHSQAVLRVNPEENAALKDVVLRAALTHLATGELTEAPRGSARVLRYIRDRISVPRDMSLYAARHMRASLEIVAASSTPEPGATVPFADVPIKHRKDQDPRPFNYSS